MYLSEIPGHRDVVMERICKCNAVIDLIRPEDQPDMETPDMTYKYIFPYDYIMDKTTEVGTYLCLGVAAPHIIDRTFFDFRIYFWIVSHERTMHVPKGLVTNLLSCGIDRLMNGSQEFGPGRVELMGWNRFMPTNDLCERSLIYRTVNSSRE